MLSRFRFAFGLTALLVAACSTSDRSTGNGAAPSEPPSSDLRVTASVAHRDMRVGVPTFSWFRPQAKQRFTDARMAAKAAVGGLAQSFLLASDAIASLGTPEIHDSGLTLLARYRQEVRGLEVFRGGATIAMRRDFEPVAASTLIAPSLVGSERAFDKTSESAMARAVSAVTGGSSLARAEDKNGYERYRAPGVREARVKRVYFPTKSGLEPAHYAEVSTYAGAARSFVYSAIDGRTLFENDLVHYDTGYTYRVYADPTTKLPMDGPQGNAYAPHPTGTPDAIKPTWVESQLVTLANFPFSKNDPWLPASATELKGNNVHAYADLVSPDGFAMPGDLDGIVSSGTSFDYHYDTNASPGATTTSQRAATTQLFYITNFLHDWFYDAGFDETSANHQASNLGRGGKEGDELLAEAQDYSGRNNANAQVPADGSSPIIQMFVFSGQSTATLTVNSPASIAGAKTVGVSGGFGKDLFDISGTVVLGVDDGGADANDGCETLSQATGKIVLVHRGTCSFAQKAANAQAAGAIGALIANVGTSVQPTTAPFMGGTQQGITIPVLSLNQADGAALEAAVAQNPTISMKREGGVDLDGALDTSIVSHEWGHVLSGRLVGNGNGLNTNQAGGLGEGWGDFVALLVSARGDDPGNFGGAYANGSYAMSGSGSDIYFGTRRVPYSIDFDKNPLTFKHIQNGVTLPSSKASISFGEEGGSNAEVHNTGEVWATMLWECYVGLLRDGRYSFADAQERMKKYLVAGLKLTPVDPTLLEARDAMIAAAMASDEKDAQVFWAAFARRGAGAGATGPDKESASNGPVTESFENGNAALVTEAKLDDDVISCDHDGILDEGEVGSIEIAVKNAGSGTLEETKAKLSSKTPGVSLIDASEIPLGKLAPFQSTTLKLKTSVRASAPLDVVDIDVDLSDPTFKSTQTVHVTVPARYQADEAEASSAKDLVETTKTAWTTATSGSKSVQWARFAEGANHYWTIANGASSSDNRLTSPRFATGTSFSISFKHRYFFRSSTRRQADFDGGVVELSIDGGSTWKDVSNYGAVDYNTTLDAQGRGQNPLKGKKAYGNKSKGYPEWITSKIDVTLPAPAESVAMRFRAANGDAFTVNADGWDIDDIEIGGIESTPFWSFVQHADACDPNAPTANAGPSKTVAPKALVKLEGSASAPSGQPLTYLWRQVSGPPVVLKEESTATPSFEAPAEQPSTVAFELRAHDGTLLSAASKVDVKVASAAAPASKDDGGGCSCKTAGGTPSNGSAALAALAAFGLFGARRRRRCRF